MAESRPSSRNIGEIYDQQAEKYAEFADNRFAWTYLELPAFDKYIFDLYRPETRVLDIGCGTGVVARHLIARGVRPENIIGIDTSQKQLDQARATTPGVRFIEASAHDFDLPSGSIELITTNTVGHHLDNEQFEGMLQKSYDVLSPDGCYFFVDVDPDHSAEGRDPQNLNKWTTVKTPWGTDVPFFNRDPDDLVDMFDRHGFDKVGGWVLRVVPEGIVDPKNFARYSSRPSRMAARYQKVPYLTKVLRFNDLQQRPNLVDTPIQRIQRQLVDQYFHAWQTQSIEILADVFAPEAEYDEKPGMKEPLHGLEAIQAYWRINPLSQRNIQIQSKIVGFSGGNSIWSEFEGSFDVRGQCVRIKGFIQFTIDPNKKKVTRLTEYFITDKSPAGEK